MKARFTLIILFIAAFFAANAQQVPNAGFETWTNPGNPDGWATWESATGAPLGLATKDTAVKVQGTSSLKLKTDSVQAGPQKLLIAGLASLGTATYTPPNIDFAGVPFIYRVDTLFFSYKYTPVGNDTAWIEIQISGTTGDLLFGGLTLTATNGQWINVYVPMTGDVAPGVVDSIRLLFSSSLPSSSGVQGSVLNVDAIRFGYVNPPTAIEPITTQTEVIVFPNPASEVINIVTKEIIEGGFVMMSDISGKLVSVNNLEGQKTGISISEFLNGIYIYRIADKTGNILKEGKFNVVK